MCPQKKLPTEPVYAEPIKPSAAALKIIPPARCSSSSTDASQSDEHDGVQLRHGPKTIENEMKSDTEQVTYENTSILNTEKNGKARHSDSHVMTEYSNRDSEPVVQQSVNNGQRKCHSKSLSLSENRIAANLNPFQQNRELWEKRTEMQSTHSLTAPRILTRNRIAPDLVMDLPVSNKESAVHSSRESLNSSDEIVGSDGVHAGSSTAKMENVVINSKSIEDMTTAERFATQSQCTLKKNERFSAGTVNNDVVQKENQNDFKAGSSAVLANRTSTNEKPKAEIKPQESTLIKEFTRVNSDANSDTSASVILKDQATIKPTVISKDSQHKSPIPSRNTQKFVSQFADLKLTGGCLSSGSNTTAINTVTDTCNSQHQQQQPPTSLSSFKPQVKVKPQILRKPLVLPPTTPESVRRNQEP